MVDNGFVFAMNKWSEQKHKREAKKSAKLSKVHDICTKYGVSVDELNSDEMTKAEYTCVCDYLTKFENYPLRFYPNLLIRKGVPYDK